MFTFCFEDLSEVKVAAHCLQMLFSCSSFSLQFPASLLPQLGVHTLTSILHELRLYCKFTLEFEKKLQTSFFDIQPFSPLAVLHEIILKGNLDFYL